MAMADAHNARGKNTLLGQDKGLIKYKVFENKLDDILQALVIDKVVDRTAEPTEYWAELLALIELWKMWFPRWPDAYAFAANELKRSPIGVDLVRLRLIRLGYHIPTTNQYDYESLEASDQEWIQLALPPARHWYPVTNLISTKDGDRYKSHLRKLYLRTWRHVMSVRPLSAASTVGSGVIQVPAEDLLQADIPLKFFSAFDDIDMGDPQPIAFFSVATKGQTAEEDAELLWRVADGVLEVSLTVAGAEQELTPIAKPKTVEVDRRKKQLRTKIQKCPVCHFEPLKEVDRSSGHTCMVCKTVLYVDSYGNLKVDN